MNLSRLERRIKEATRRHGSPSDYQRGVAEAARIEAEGGRTAVRQHLLDRLRSLPAKDMTPWRKQALALAEREEAKESAMQRFKAEGRQIMYTGSGVVDRATGEHLWDL